jgi:hypothetical protein
MLFSASTQGVIKLHTKAMKLEENYIVEDDIIHCMNRI